MLKLTALVSVLFLGDSHTVGPFGQALNQRLRTETSAQVSTYGVCGAVAGWFRYGQETGCGFFSQEANGDAITASRARTPLARERLATLRPNLTIVALGTNYAPMLLGPNPSREQNIKDDMRELALAVREVGSDCLWVSLPKTRKFQAIEQTVLRLTQEAVGDLCDVVDSLAVTEYPRACFDGVHYNCTDGQVISDAWSRVVIERVK
jgi:hypothetical protein